MEVVKKKKILYKIITIVLFIIIIVSQAIHVNNKEGIPSQSELVYVNDFANVLSEESKEYIINFNEFLSSKREKSQIIVTTIDSFGPYAKWDYINRMFKSYNVNPGFKNNGILIIYSKKDNKFYVKTFMGDRRSYIKKRVEFLKESSKSLLDKGNIDKAVLNVFKNAGNLICYNYYYDAFASDTVGFENPASMDMVLNVVNRYKVVIIGCGGILVSSFLCIYIGDRKIKTKVKNNTNYKCEEDI